MQRLELALADSRTRNKELQAKVRSLSGELTRVRERAEEAWKLSCTQVAALDETIAARDATIEQLTAKVTDLEARAPVDAAPPSIHSVHALPVIGGSSVVTDPAGVPAPRRRGKAPPD